MFPMLSILDILRFSISYIEEILANCLLFITVQAASGVVCPSRNIYHYTSYIWPGALPEEKQIVLFVLFSKFMLCFAT